MEYWLTKVGKNKDLDHHMNLIGDLIQFSIGNILTTFK